MPVYTLNPSHKRSGSHKASRAPSLRERMTMRRNPEPKHLVLMPHRDYVAFRTSDGRTGSEPNMGPGKSGPTMALLLNKLGVLTENGMSPNWTVEVIKQEPSVLDTYLEGRPANRRRNPLSEDGAVVSNPNVMGNAIIWTPAGEGKYDGQIFISEDGGRRTQAPYMASVRRASDGWDWLIIGWASSRPLASGHAASLREAQKAAGAVAVPSHHMNPRRKGGAKPSAKRSGGRTAAQGNAAKAMKLYHSGQASSLAEAWQMVRGSSARRNPLSEDGMVVSNPRREDFAVSVKGKTVYTPGKKSLMDAAVTWTKVAGGGQVVHLKGITLTVKATKNGASYSITRDGHVQGGSAANIGQAKALALHYALRPASEFMQNPRSKGAKRGSKRSGGRTAAQSNAAKAMKLFHSGQASSLAEAWDMVRRGR